MHAVDVRVLHNALTYPIMELIRLGVDAAYVHTYQLFLIKACNAICFGQKIVLLYNCTLNFYFNLFRSRTLDLTMDLF